MDNSRYLLEQLRTEHPNERMDGMAADRPGGVGTGADMPTAGAPNPGSAEAVARGCTCAQLDNHRGRGAWGGVVRDVNGDPIFWISPGCPLHGEKQRAVKLD